VRKWAGRWKLVRYVLGDALSGDVIDTDLDANLGQFMQIMPNHIGAAGRNRGQGNIRLDCDIDQQEVTIELFSGAHFERFYHVSARDLGVARGDTVQVIETRCEGLDAADYLELVAFGDRQIAVEDNGVWYLFVRAE
jgi:hypothetical protein